MRRRLPMEWALLGFLIEAPIHGYDLHQRVRESLGRVWYMGRSNVYSALKRLEDAGYVEATLEPQGGRPPRKIYHVTPKGEEKFLAWVRAPAPSMQDMRVEFLAKLYFFRLLGLDGVEDLIAQQERACRKRIDRLNERAEQREAHAFDRLVFDFRRRQIEAILDWLASCREVCQRWGEAVAEAG